MQYYLMGSPFFAQYVTADLEIIETTKPSPISHCLTGNVVFNHRVTGHFGPFIIAHNTVLYAERVILLTSECPSGGGTL